MIVGQHQCGRRAVDRLRERGVVRPLPAARPPRADRLAAVYRSLVVLWVWAGWSGLRSRVAAGGRSLGDRATWRCVYVGPRSWLVAAPERRPRWRCSETRTAIEEAPGTRKPVAPGPTLRARRAHGERRARLPRRRSRTSRRRPRRGMRRLAPRCQSRDSGRDHPPPPLLEEKPSSLP